MAIYNREGQSKKTPTVVPDGFLSLGVERHKREDLGRLSYVVKEENEIVPLLALEMVSKTYGKEYDEKFHNYEQLGRQILRHLQSGIQPPESAPIL